MAPGRRRGAKGAKSKSELNLGDLVLAKVKGHPAWPAKISRPEDWEKAPDPKKCFVHFFGTNEIAFVLPADIQAFTIEAKNKVLARCKGKTVKYFAKAVKEICAEFEELQQKSSSGTGTDTDKHDSESEGPSIHGMDDDAKVTGPQGDTEMKALEDEGCVLGRCSRSQEGDASGGGEADGSSPASMSGQKEVTNGNKSKKIIPGSKRKLEGDVQSEKITGAVGSLRRDKIHLEGADDIWKDTKGTFKEKVGRNVNPVKRSNSEDVAVDLAKGSVQRNRESAVLDSKAGDAKNRLPPRATAGSFDTNAAPSDDSVLQPAKRRRQDSMAGSSTRSSIDKTGKGFTALRNDSKKVKSPPVSQFPPKRRAVRLYDDDDEEEPKTPVHGGSFRKADAPSRVLDSVKSTSAHGERSIHEQAPGAHEDGSSKVLASLTVKPLSESLSPSSRQHVVRPKRASTLATYVSRSPEKIESDKMSSDEAGPVLVSPMRSPLAVGVAKPVVDPIRVNKTPVKVSDNVSQRKTHSGANKNTHVVSEPVLDLPMRSPLSVAVAKPVVELVRVNKPPVRVSDNISQRKSQPGANKNTLVVSDGLDHSPNHGLNERSKGVFSVEGQKNTPKSSSRMNDSALVAGKLTEINSSTGERLQRDKKSGREDKTSVLTDSKIEDSAMSMKHLIAVAQARRKEAHSQSGLFHGSDVTGGSPILVSNSVQSILLSGGANSMMMQPDMQGNYQAQTSFPTSPASHIHHFSSNNNHPETEEFEDRRVSSGHRSTAGGSLSGGTEAAVARDAFEGMIETLSRTKESIGRATRLAIDCAKYGIASEVVELLICKLETEPSLHRKVDLFFLVDSITQCSHGQKGIAGASYIPTVQAALPRLLGAAAPPGAVARENRKQCLKVLRLWLERKILPESLLRHYIDDIGVSNDDTSSAGVFLRRPSRAERAIDDPVREMDGMLVDEYGSNSTSQLLGLLSSGVFDEEEEEEEQNQDLSRDLCKVDGDRSPVEPTCTVGETEEFAVTPSDSRRHCILQDVDGELEMEDVSTHPKDERGFSAGLNFEMVSEGEGQGRIFEEGQNSFTELTPPQEDSPPLPLDSPPPTPPLPSSPPPPSPPPPPPSSPSPPPPPPPPLPSQAHMHPPPPAGMPLSLVPQPPTVPHHIHPFQSSLPSSSPSLAYQPLAPPSGSQTVQVAGNAPRGPHIDVNMRNGMFPQPPAFFVPSGPSGYNNSARPAVDYVVRNDLYANPQTSQPNQQQFQPGLPPLTQRPPFHPAPPPQAPSSQFSYSKPTTVQQIPQQQPYPPQYSVVPTHPDGTNWRMPANEFSSTDNQHGLWINGGRNSSGSVPSFPQEGYFRPPLNRPPSNNLSFQPPPERPPSNNASFQPPAVNTLPAGPPIPAAGHVGPQMVPIRPDFSTLGSWRPA